jgi:hypothetical protein
MCVCCVWELRHDDFRSGGLILRPDGSLTATSKEQGRAPFPDYHGVWSLVSEDGPQYLLEFGSGPASADTYRVSLVLTCREAFTLVETERGGVRVRDQVRFIRTGAAPPKSR